MHRDVFSTGEAEFLAFATTFNAAVVTHAAPLGIPNALVSHKKLTSSKLLSRPREILTFEDTQLDETLYIPKLGEREGPAGPALSDTGTCDSLGKWSKRRVAVPALGVCVLRKRRP
jgi:hypothetical protein